MLGYGIGYIGQGSTYNFMAAYFVVFLTNCVGLDSAMAGSITSVALLVEVVAGMIVGNLSDNCTSSMGKKAALRSCCRIDDASYYGADYANCRRFRDDAFYLLSGSVHRVPSLLFDL